MLKPWRKGTPNQARDQPATAVLGVGTALAGLVILGVLVDAPQVVQLFAGQNIAGAEHGRHHRVILVVVLVHAVTADDVQSRITRCQLEAQHVDVFAYSKS